jgi:hypothetical protein
MKKKKKWKNYEIKIIFLFDNSYTQLTTDSNDNSSQTSFN